MARALFSGIGITSVQGRIGTQTITRNRSGAIIKGRGTGPTSISTALADWRSLYNVVHAQYMTLTDAQREAWHDAAVGYDRGHQLTEPRGNMMRLGVLTALQYFLQVNLNLALVGESLTDDPRLPLDPLPYLSNFQASYDTGSDTVMIAFNYDVQVLAGWSAVLYSTFAMSIGRMSTNQRYSAYQTPLVISPVSGTYTNTFTGTWATRFPTALAVPFKVFFQIYLINIRTGQRSTALQTRVTAT